MDVPNGAFFIRVNTRLLSYRRNENAQKKTKEGGEKKGAGRGARRSGEEKGVERVSRQGNASAVNEQTLIFSRTKTHPLTTTYLPPTTSQPPMFRNSGKGGNAEKEGGMTRRARCTRLP